MNYFEYNMRRALDDMYKREVFRATCRKIDRKIESARRDLDRYARLIDMFMKGSK